MNQPEERAHGGSARLALLVLGVWCGCSAAPADPSALARPPTITSSAGTGAAAGAASAPASGGETAGGSAPREFGQAGVASSAGSMDAAGGGNMAGTITSSNVGCKRGIATPVAPLVSGGLGNVSWWYNWTASEPAKLPNIEFVPMVWGAAQLKDAATELPASARYLLGFNEPNFFAQANLSAQTAAALWPQMEQLASARGALLVSPAVNYCGDDDSKTGPCHDTNPLDYLTEFFAACSGCRVDYVAVHWYNCSLPELQFYLRRFERFGKPVWLTEFACGYGGDTSAAGQEQYMRAAVPMLEADSNVYRYAWFSGGGELPEARLQGPTGELTPLGRVYATLPRGASCKP